MDNSNETILVTGAKGMIGSRLVKGLLDAGYSVIGIDRSSEMGCENNYKCYACDLGDAVQLKKIFDKHKIDRIIHLAALAHTDNEDDTSWKRYYHINVECAKNVFELCGDKPVLFISTVDVFGFFNGGTVTPTTPLVPVTSYGKSKKMAEEECAKLHNYTIFRLSPVYTSEIKRDIRKRYYLKYPSIAYQIGNGTEYEVLNVDKAVSSMVDWCRQTPLNEVKIIKDDKPMWTPDYIREEKSYGRAKIVLKFPKWAVDLGYKALVAATEQNKYTYLLNKAVYPLRTGQ